MMVLHKKHFNILERKHYDGYENASPTCKTYRATYENRSVVARSYDVDVRVAKEKDFCCLGINNLFYFGSVKKDGVRYHVFDKYCMNLQELQTQILNPDPTIIPQVDREDWYAFCVECQNLQMGGRPTSWGYKILRDVLNGLKDLSSHHASHGNLTVNNVVLVFLRGQEIQAKLMGRINVSDDEYTDDIGYGNIVKFCLGTSSPEVCDMLGILDPEYNIKGVPFLQSQWQWLRIKTRESFRRDPSVLKSHPLFWDADKCLSFYSHLSRLIKALKGFEADWRDLAKPEEVQFIRVMKRIYLGTSVYRCEDTQRSLRLDGQPLSTSWGTQIRRANQVIGDSLSEFDLYRGHYHDSCYLIRFIYKTYKHLQESSFELQAAYGRTVESYYNFFRDLFPCLLIQAYRIVQIYITRLERRQELSYYIDALSELVGVKVLGLDAVEEPAVEGNPP